MQFEILVNPAGASGNAWKVWKKTEKVLKREGISYTLHCSEPDYGVGEICRELTSKGEEIAVIVIGGDGTQNEAVNGIADFSRTRYGFIPCGTGNDLVRDMGLPADREELILRMLDGEVKRECDIGELTFFNEDGSVTKRRFNISSDIGFGAATCALVNSSKLKPLLNRFGLGRLCYPLKAIKVCFSAKPIPVNVTCSGKTRRYKKCLCAIAMNHCYEGGGLKFCPDADFTDGMLDLCIGNGLDHPEFLRMLPLAFKGKHLKLKGIYHERAERIILTCEQPLWVHTDGEVIGKATRADMRIIPEKLRLMI